jgi:uncharacterized protein
MSITSLIVIQPTPFCNIDCSYCYLAQRHDRTTLSIDNLRRIFQKLLTFPTISQHVTVVWHAGEPLVLGADYYETAFSSIRELCADRLKVEHSFQTNGMLINDDWCDLFERWDVGLGLSIDGPKYIHDAARKTRSGRGTYEKAMSGVDCLRRRNIPFYVITVLTKAALLDPEGMFAFYEEYGIQDVGFNVEEEEGIHKKSSLTSDFDEGLIIKFFARFTELVKDRQFPIAVRELEETLTSIRYFQLEGPLNNLVIPFGIITIDVRGNVFTFSPELAGHSSDEFATFSIGNIFTDAFIDLENSTILDRMQTQINLGIDLCRAECKYFSVCGGGAPSNKIFENGTFACTETMYCRLTRKRVADFVLATIESRNPDPTG